MCDRVLFSMSVAAKCQQVFQKKNTTHNPVMGLIAGVSLSMESK